ncbi:MAG: MFS transporter, partial [Burkholderiales bacterium]|nr:MFS transporter [Burkholderiales bacterium]
LVALCFAVYAGQWLAVIGFLPSIYQRAGVPAALSGPLTALAAAANIVGNVGAGRLLHRGHRPQRLLTIGFVAMALASAAAFAGDPGLPAWARYVAVLGFSAIGGLIPTTLFSLAVRAAPGEETLSTTIGWVQQCSACGQFGGPPLVAWVASASGSWQWTWVATGACSLAGLGLVAAITRWLATTPGVPAFRSSSRP